MSLSRTWTCIPRARWLACWRGMRDAGKTVFVVTHQAALLEGVADELSGSAGKIVDATRDLNVRGDVRGVQ